MGVWGEFINTQILWHIFLSPFRNRQFWGHICILPQWMNLVSHCVPQRSTQRSTMCKGAPKNSRMRGQPPSTFCTKGHNQAFWNLDLFWSLALKAPGFQTGTPWTLGYLGGEDEFSLSCQSWACQASDGIIKHWQGQAETAETAVAEWCNTMAQESKRPGLSSLQWLFNTVIADRGTKHVASQWAPQPLFSCALPCILLAF